MLLLYESIMIVNNSDRNPKCRFLKNCEFLNTDFARHTFFSKRPSHVHTGIIVHKWSSYDRTWFSGPDKQEILIVIMHKFVCKQLFIVHRRKKQQCAFVTLRTTLYDLRLLHFQFMCFLDVLKLCECDFKMT
jgi:hypothetical protein